jgi:hypothetical protein
MRDDMCKVIVERPRWGSRSNWKDGRLHRESEDVSPKIGMKQGHGTRKYFKDHLGPLKRWLASQVNRPWDKVYSEICEHNDVRSTVQDHLRSHVEDFVDLNTRMINGQVCVFRDYSPVSTLADSSRKLYVHPTSGLLLRNPWPKRWQREWKAETAAKAALVAAVRRDLGGMALLMKLEGTWYHVTLAAMADGVVYIKQTPDGPRKAMHRYPTQWDIVRKREVNAGKDGCCGEAYELYGRYGVYAASKRQLSAKELKQYKLTNENAGETRRFSFCYSRLRRFNTRNPVRVQWLPACCAGRASSPTSLATSFPRDIASRLPQVAI